MSIEPPARRVTTTPASSQPYANDPTLATRRLQNQTQYGGRTTTTAFNAQTTPVADPNCNLTGFKTGFQDTGRLCLGWIMDGTSIANCYRVHLEKGFTPIIATACSGTSGVAFGATEINTYSPGTCVIVMVHDKQFKGFILGAVPNVLDIGKRAYHDYISQASRKRVDDVHKKYLKQPQSGQMVDYSAWRAWDATLASEWGAITSTGAGVTLDDFMVRVSINEFCGVYGFYHDSMLRVAGYNMQVWTAGSERESIMDQAECNDTQGYSPYPWEAMGLLKPAMMIAEYEPADYQCALAKPYYAHWENKHEFQQPYHRTQQFYGYLGQGSRSVIHAPPQGLERWTYKGEKGSPGGPPYDSKIETDTGSAPDCGSGPEKDTDHDPKPAYGLREENTAQDGRLFLASAKGVVISKRILLPMPQRIKRPEDYKSGDEAEKNYKAASKYGSGPDHSITGTIKTTDNDYPNLQRAAAVLDLHGYLFNYAGLHPFYWHAKDYKTWEQQELEYAQYNQKIPKFQDLAGSKMYLKEEEPKTFKIDHRYEQAGDQKFYETESFVSLLEDGGVVIGDGYGAEIRMSGGCVFISAPGDVWLKGGRDVQTWAGNDIIQKAYKSVDISATEKNVRIKAERNVMVLAGNDSSDKEGGILLESRMKTLDYDFEKAGDEVKFAGIVMRAPNANIVSLAHQIYLRTGGGGSSIKPGNITIDAGKGEKEIVTKSNNFYEYLKQGGRHYQFFGGQGVGGTKKSNMFSENFTLLTGPLGIDKDLILNGSILCKGSVLASKGHILTSAAAKGAIFVGPCDGECQGQVNEGIDKIRDLIDKELPQTGNQIDQQLVKSLWYEEKKAGNDRVMDIAEFSFRTDDDYKIPDFVLYEDRWQQMARLGGETPEKWTEKPVKVKTGDDSFPFPGKKWTKDEQTYVEQDFKIVQPAGGYIDKQRNEAPGLADEYKNPEFKDNNKKKLDGTYPIIPRK